MGTSIMIVEHSPALSANYVDTPSHQHYDFQHVAKKICARNLPEFQLIDDPEGYRTFYKRQIEQEECDLDMDNTLSCMGVYDVDHICRPAFHGDEFVFYATDSNQVPRKVSVDLKSRHIASELLPLIY